MKTVRSAFVTFFSSLFAEEAKEAITNRDNMNNISLSVLSSKNVADKESGHIPKLFCEELSVGFPVWYVSN